MLFVAGSKYATQAIQALQRCSVNVRLVQSVTRIRRRWDARRYNRAFHGKGHCGDPLG